MLNNKKGQIQQPTYSAVNPVLIIGIVMFVIPFFNFLLPFKFPDSLFKTIGIILILIGSGIAIYKASQR